MVWINAGLRGSGSILARSVATKRSMLRGEVGLQVRQAYLAAEELGQHQRAHRHGGDHQESNPQIRCHAPPSDFFQRFVVQQRKRNLPVCAAAGSASRAAPTTAISLVFITKDY